MKRNTAILRGLAAVTALGTMLCTTATSPRKIAVPH
mgnify:CR=1 FL=1